MNIEAIEYDSELTPDVILRNAVTYNGHTLNVLVFAGPSGFDISWSVETIDSRNHGGTVYPKNFAEMEVCQIISEQLAEMPEANGLGETTWTLLQAIALSFGGGN